MDQSPQLVMLNDSLLALPPVVLKEGYTSCTFRPGDEAAWERVIGESFGHRYLFTTMTEDEQFRPERVFFICHEGIPVATASAWWRPQWGEDTGYLHMVGVLPNYAGQRLGYLVSLLAMHRLAEEKRTRAILETDDFRIPAIVSYLKLGFEPKLVHPNQVERWKKIFTDLNDQERLGAMLSQ